MAIQTKRLWNIGVALAVLVTLYSLVGFFAMPPILRRIAEGRLSELLRRPVTIKALRTNPYVLSAVASQITVQGGRGEPALASAREIYVNVQALSLVKWAWILQEMRVQEPFLRLIRLEGDRYNVSDLFEKKGFTDQGAGGISSFAVHNIQLVDGKVEFIDRPADSRHVVDDLGVRVPFVSNLDVDVETWVLPAISATVNGSPLTVEGRTRPFSPRQDAVIDIDVQGLDVGHYLAYLPGRHAVNVRSGALDVMGHVMFSRPPDAGPSLVLEGRVALSELDVADRQGERLLTLPAVELKGVSWKPLEGELRISDTTVQEPALQLARNEGGVLNWADVMALGGDVEDGSVAGGHAATAADGQRYAVTLGRVVVADGRIAFADRSTARNDPAEETGHGKGDPYLHVTVDRINGSAANLSPITNTEGSVALSCYVEEGTVTATGSIRFSPLSLDVDVTTEKLDVTPAQWYFPDNLKLRLGGGRLQSTGNVLVSAAEDRQWRVVYTGDVSLLDLSSTGAENERWVGWKRLDVKGLRGEYNPTRVVVETATLSGLNTRVEIGPDASLNLMEVWEEHSSPPAASAAASPAEDGRGEFAPVRIDKLLVRDGNVAFSDRHITPPVTATLTDLDGTVLGVSTEKGTESEVTITGRSDQGAPLRIEGKLGPVSDAFFMKLNASFEHVDLTRMDPYARRYVGYALQKGNLSVELNYTILQRKLEAGNEVILDGLTLGERVESPQATSLPVKFAVALLKDREGKVRLNVPVTGDLDNPRFDFGESIAQAVRRFFLKVVSAPFALLASLVGRDGGELRYVDFEPGDAAIPGAGRDKLDTVIEGLYRRPALELDIQGHYDPERDAAVLSRRRLEEKLRMRKHRDLLAQGNDVALEAVSLTPEERDRYLRELYQKEIVESGDGEQEEVPAKLSPVELEQALLARIDIGDEDLRLLAQRRAVNVKAYLVDSQKVEASRIFLVRPTAQEVDEGENEGEITLTLK